jgi:hypothetical protein
MLSFLKGLLARTRRTATPTSAARIAPLSAKTLEAVDGGFRLRWGPGPGPIFLNPQPLPPSHGGELRYRLA